MKCRKSKDLLLGLPKLIIHVIFLFYMNLLPGRNININTIDYHWSNITIYYYCNSVLITYILGCCYSKIALELHVS